LPVSKTVTIHLSPLALLLPPAAVYRRSFDIIHLCLKRQITFAFDMT
ncbi:unnamed protein product, partial [Brassica rapa subsp. trilocularis]